jgi:hypothetical protein
MPLHVVGEEAEEDTRFHVILSPVPDRPYEKIESLQVPEGRFSTDSWPPP